MSALHQVPDLPRVPVTTFKRNLTAYIQSGAVVTNHGHPRAALLPIDTDATADGSLEAVKAQLLLLTRLVDREAAAAELAELAASRDAETVEAGR